MEIEVNRRDRWGQLPWRSGISRNELVLLLLILALLGGLSASLIVKLRASAAQMACQNNLRQIALGVHFYHDVNSRLPALTNQGTAHSPDDIRSVFATLGPYLESSVWFYRPGQPASNYHASSSVPFIFQNKDGTEGTRYGGDANQVWRTFIDPADATTDQHRDVSMIHPDGSTGYYATGSYAANGILPWGGEGVAKTKRLSDWPAGTILFSERPQVCRPANGDAVYNLWGVGFYSPQIPAFALLTPAEPVGLWSTELAVPDGLSSTTVVDRSGEMRVRIGRTSAVSQAVDFPTPIQLIDGSKPCDPRLPGSPHRAGMQTAVIDGGVRVFAPGTEPWVFWAACSLSE